MSDSETTTGKKRNIDETTGASGGRESKRYKLPDVHEQIRQDMESMSRDLEEYEEDLKEAYRKTKKILADLSPEKQAIVQESGLESERDREASISNDVDEIMSFMGMAIGCIAQDALCSSDHALMRAAVKALEKLPGGSLDRLRPFLQEIVGLLKHLAGPTDKEVEPMRVDPIEKVDYAIHEALSKDLELSEAITNPQRHYELTLKLLDRKMDLDCAKLSLKDLTDLTEIDAPDDSKESLDAWRNMHKTMISDAKARIQGLKKEREDVKTVLKSVMQICVRRFEDSEVGCTHYLPLHVKMRDLNRFEGAADSIMRFCRAEYVAFARVGPMSWQAPP